MIQIPHDIPHEFLRPITEAWTQKITAAERARAPWRDVANKCRMFYNRSANAMWDHALAQQFWRGVTPPRIKIAINLAYEYAAIMLPELLWDVPHRNCKPKVPANDLGPELFGGEQSPLWQMRQQELQQRQVSTNAVVSFMSDWLNYTPREMPGGGLTAHSELATLDALIVGRGTQWVAPYSFPGSGERLVGSFYEPPERLLIDPDYSSIHEAKWIARKHVDPWWEVERRFKLPNGSLRKHASTHSAWSQAELATVNDVERQRNKTNDLVVWYEIFSKTGPGARMTGMDYRLRMSLEETVGDFAYIAVSPGIPYPLNCPSEEFRQGITPDEVKRKLSWPVPLWQDNRWPVECLDFYDNTDPSDPSAAWPIPPLAPALGEIELLNHIIPFLVNRVYQSTRDFWVIAERFRDKLEQQLNHGSDMSVIGVPPPMEGDVGKMVQILSQPETRRDAWAIVELAIEMFRKRTGLIEEKYGQAATQSRTAEDAKNKAAAVGARGEYMRNKLVAYQGRLAELEAYQTHMFVRPEDVVNRYGQTGALAWRQYVTAMPLNQVLRQVAYSIEASSVRRPNRDRDINNMQEVQQYWGSMLQTYAEGSGNYEPLNGMFRIWGKLHDMDVSPMLIPPQQQDEEMQELQREAAALENDKLEAETGKLEAETQAKIVEAQAKSTEGETKRGESVMNLLSRQLDMALDQEKHDQQMDQDEERHTVSLIQDQEKFQQDLSHQESLNKVRINAAKRPATNGTTKRR